MVSRLALLCSAVLSCYSCCRCYCCLSPELDGHKFHATLAILHHGIWPVCFEGLLYCLGYTLAEWKILYSSCSSVFRLKCFTLHGIVLYENKLSHVQKLDFCENSGIKILFTQTRSNRENGKVIKFFFRNIQVG